MKRQITIRRLFAVLMIAGIALAPMSRPIMAATSPDVSMLDVPTLTMAAEMADDISMAKDISAMAMDMPCCPSQAPVPGGCDQCIFMATCTAQCFAGVFSQSAFQPVFTMVGGVAPLHNESQPDSLRNPPPDQPPRTSH